MLRREFARHRDVQHFLLPAEEETMSFLDDGRPLPKPKFAVDDDLSLLSLEELEERIAAFKTEIKRNEEDLERKRQSLSAADSVFKI